VKVNTRKIARTTEHIGQQALDLLFPPQCVGCKRSGSVLCSACMATFQKMPQAICPRCGHPLEATRACSQCRYHMLGLSGLRAACIYQGSLRSCIHMLKYEGNKRLAAPLGQVLVQAYYYYGLRADVLVPVPLHHERERQRGYNHAALLAEACSLIIKVPVRLDIAARHKATQAQVDLAASERRQNVAGAFHCTPAFASGALHGCSILLIDDVSTTGATLEACAAPLFAAGAKAVWGLVLARPFNEI
jgi:ComF family protein